MYTSYKMICVYVPHMRTLYYEIVYVMLPSICAHGSHDIRAHIMIYSVYMMLRDMCTWVTG